MQALLRILTIISFMMSTGCEYIPFSGNELDGTVAETPANWSSAAEASVIQLETNPQDPYSVKLWVVGLGPALYVHAGANHTTWVENIEANPNVRVLIDRKIYELNAVRVQDAAEFKRFSDAYENKYGTRPRNENIAEVYLFRCESRET